MTRALLEQALNALEWHTQQTRPIHNTELAIEALRDELAKPEPTQPAWHDAPTEAGLWVNNRNMSAYKISAEHIRRGVFNARWFGPISEDSGESHDPTV